MTSFYPREMANQLPWQKTSLIQQVKTSYAAKLAAMQIEEPYKEYVYIS